jgi:ATP-dependent helicase/nuclease subunit A
MFELTPHQINALNTQSSISLTANAGSGKTFVLANRYLKVILETNTSIHEIAAITFTEKAAGELYGRIAQELNDLSEQINPPQIHKKIVKLRKQLVSANISTIHSFCVDLLKEFPVEASIDANFIPIDQRTSDELIELSIERTIQDKISPKVEIEDVKLLIRLLGSKRVLSHEIAELVQNRKNLFRVKEFYSNKSPEEIAIAFSEKFNSGLKELLMIELPNILTHLNNINEKVLSNNSKNEIALSVRSLIEKAVTTKITKDVLKCLAGIKDEAFTKSITIKSRGYLSNDLRDEMGSSISHCESSFKELEKLILIENTFNLERELAKYSKAMLNISLNVIEEYNYIKNQMGYLDFEDILLKTKEIISNEDVRKNVQKKYKYLLVDEYQDTNEIQYEIFLPIVDYLKSGNLFIVGDEKQSIYRFRDAELEVFGKTINDIKNASDENLILSLPDSFRMAPAICLFTNHLFKKLFDNSQKMYGEVAHSDLVCARDDSIEGKVEFLISSNHDDLTEAELVAKRIIKLKNESREEIPDWSNIAVLVRKRSAFSELEKTFVKFNIPFAVIGGTGFYQQQSTSDIFNYFAFLFNTSDDAALIGILRSPFFLVSDVKIYQLSTFHGDSYWEKLKNGAEKDNYWKPLYLSIDENLSLIKRISIPSLLQKILNESNFIPTIASRSNGEQEINNINKLTSITIKFFNQEFNSLYDYLNFLKNSIGKFADESQAGIEDKSNCVNIMTIHQAKGLQYSAVFLYRCNDTIQSGNVKSRSFIVDRNLGLLTKVPQNDNYFGSYFSAPVVELHNFFENKKSVAELKRLLYVGISRAKNFLFISTNSSSDKNNKLNSFIDLLMSALETDFTQSFFSIDGNLDFLVKSDSAFNVVNRKINIQIPQLKDVELLNIKEEKEVQKELGENFLIDFVNDHSKGEIISATKFSVFKDCSLKYNLIYNLNLNAINSDYNKWIKNYTQNDGLEFSPNEQRKIISEEQNVETYINSKIKGRLIHKILQSKTSTAEVEKAVNKLLKNENILVEELNHSAKQVEEDIVKSVFTYLESKENRFLNSFKNFKNEFEVYCKEGDFYLFGIIDKVVFTKNKIVIVDYKTDNILESQINTRGEKYLSQLNFYALILNRIYPLFSEVEIRIIFLKFPDKPFVKMFTKNDENEIKSTLSNLIISIRNNNYSVNLDHCSQCIFSANNNRCIASVHSANTATNNK